MKIPVSKAYFKHLLLTHPDYPSLLSITETLDVLGIENAAMVIENTMIKNISTPFLAHLVRNGGEFIVVRKSDNKNQNLDTVLTDWWDGVIVLGEKSEQWTNEKNNQWLKKEKSIKIYNYFFIGLIGILATALIFIQSNWLHSFLFLIGASGIFISWLIVNKDLKIDNAIAHQVCGKDADCDDVIHSKAVKLPFDIGLSDAGIIWFSFLLILITIPLYNRSSIDAILSILATCAVPFIFFRFIINGE